MSLSAGARLGPYEIIALLGAGGMGEVYRARDTRLDRDVAIKILPQAFVADTERVARFLREAKVLASLNHPHIAAIYGLEDADDLKGLVMELVEGEDLAQALAHGAIPLDEALRIAKQIAEALEAAHDQGVIHRDLKPANVKVCADGTVKVLDFGLAKAKESSVRSEQSVAISPTITSPAITGVGVLLGTAAYMSPEQARGKPADKRSDVWAFGCVLYEMLTGIRPFDGEDVSDTLAAVLRGEPVWHALPRDTPASIRALLRGCLEKDRNKRIADLSTARFVIDAPDLLPTPGSSGLRRFVLWAGVLALVVAGALAITLWNAFGRSSPPGPVVRFMVPLPQGQGFGAAPGLPVIAISPDAGHLVYAASGRLYLRSLSDTISRPIAGTEGGPVNPVFSPDGQSIAFFTTTGPVGSASALPRGVIKRVPLAGGTPLTVCETAFPLGMSWGADGLLFGQASKGVMRVSADGGEPQILVQVAEDEIALRPQMLPGRGAVMFTLASTNLLRPQKSLADPGWDEARVVVQLLDTRERKTVIEGGSDGRYMPTGHIVYALAGTLRAIAFDITRSEVTGGAATIVEGVARTRYSLIMTGSAQYSVSETGSLVYLPGPVSTSSAPPRDLALYDRAGRVEPLNLPPMLYESPRMSPNGKELAVSTSDVNNMNVWLYDLAGKSPPRQLTLQGRNRYPIWSADGRRVAFQSDREGDLAIFSQPADGARPAERLTTPASGTAHVPQAWSPDDEYMLFTASTDSGFSLETFAARTRTTEHFANVRSATLPPLAVFSPDGKWVAYQWRQTSQPPKVRIQSFSNTRVEHQIPVDALNPRWSPGGMEVFFSLGPSIYSIAVSTQPKFTFGSSLLLVKSIPLGGSSQRNYDLVNGGERFVGITVAAGYTPSTAAAIRQIEVVLNWLEELKARVPAQ